MDQSSLSPVQTDPIWSSKALIHSNMPKVFKEKYPSTRVIIDATEVYVEKPALPELQQLTISTYKITTHTKA